MMMMMMIVGVASNDADAERIIQIAETRQGSGHWAQPTGLLNNTKPCSPGSTNPQHQIQLGNNFKNVRN